MFRRRWRGWVGKEEIGGGECLVGGDRGDW